MRKHDWFHYFGWTGRGRTCVHCGKAQAYECVNYDRLTGSRYAWRPKIGRCKEIKSNA